MLSGPALPLADNRFPPLEIYFSLHKIVSRAGIIATWVLSTYSKHVEMFRMFRHCAQRLL